MLQVGKRFFKADDQSQDAQTGFFAKLAARDKVAMKRAEEERRARKVALTRSYRKGDLPDIQVRKRFEPRMVSDLLPVSGVLC